MGRWGDSETLAGGSHCEKHRGARGNRAVSQKDTLCTGVIDLAAADTLISGLASRFADGSKDLAGILIMENQGCVDFQRAVAPCDV